MLFKESEENKSVSSLTRGRGTRKKQKLRWDGPRSYESGIMWHHMIMIILVDTGLGHNRSAAVPCNIQNAWDVVGHFKGYLNKGGSIGKYKAKTE